MTEESLHKIFADIKTAPSETTVAEVSQWIDASLPISDASGITQFFLQNKLIIMTSLITTVIIGAIIFKSQDSEKIQQIKNNSAHNRIEQTITSDSIEKPSTQIKTINPYLPVGLSDTTPPSVTTLNNAEDILLEKASIRDTNQPPVVNNSNIQLMPLENHSANGSGSWKSANDSLRVDTIFNGIKALVFTGHVNDKISVVGSSRTNVRMNFEYKYKAKGLYVRKDRGCEISYDKKDSVLTVRLERKNSVNIGVSYVKERNDISFEVPENVEVKIKSSYGDIQIMGLKENNIHLQTSYGDIKADSISGDIDIATGYGDISLNNVQGKIEANTSYGDIIGKDISLSDSMNLRSGYGDINCQILNPVSACKLDLKTGFGKIKIKRNDLEIESGSKLIFGTGNFIISAKSGYGDIIIK